MRESVDGPSTENLQRAVAPHLGRVYRLPQIGFRASTVSRVLDDEHRAGRGAPHGTLFTSEPPALDRTWFFSAEIRHVGWRRGRLRALKILASKLTASMSSAVVLTSWRPSRWPCT